MAWALGVASAGGVAAQGLADAPAVRSAPTDSGAGGVGVNGRATMKDGMVVMGEVLGLSGGDLTIKTDSASAGEVTLAWDEVESLTTDAEVRFYLADDVERSGRLVEGGAPGELRVLAEGAAEPTSFAIGDVLAINAAPVDAFLWSGGIDLGLSAARGNTDNTSITARARLGLVKGRHEALLKYASNYGEDEETVTARNSRGSLAYNYFLTRRLFLAADASVEEDLFQDIELRTIYSGGLGWQFLRAGDLDGFWLEGLAFRTSAGLAYLDENRREAEGRDFLAGRWTADLGWTLWDGVKLYHDHEGLVSFEDAEDVLVITHQGIELSVVADLTAKFGVDWTWNNQPSPGFGRNDLLYVATLGYAFSM